jgi:hypothetical protein
VSEKKPRASRKPKRSEPVLRVMSPEDVAFWQKLVCVCGHTRHDHGSVGVPAGPECWKCPCKTFEHKPEDLEQIRRMSESS